MREVIAHKHSRHDKTLSEILELIRSSFSYMDTRIDPPSSMHRLTHSDIADKCDSGEIWSIGNPIQACVFLTEKEDTLHLSKLAVAVDVQRSGLARRLVNLAEKRARLCGKKYLELQTRIELVENHAAFCKLGFEKNGEGAHDGYDRATYIWMRKQVQDSEGQIVSMKNG
ncbi:MAG: GNAT family N-acetyltransferase [Granulosicoccus sp.]